MCFVNLSYQYLFYFHQGGERHCVSNVSSQRTQHNDLARVRIWDYSMPVSNDFKVVSGFPKLQEQAHHLSSISKLKIKTEIK